MNRLRLPRRLGLLAGCVTLCAAVFVLYGCSKPTSRELQPGSYRATVALPGDKSVPFGLDVAREENGLVLYVINGDERVRLDGVKATTGEIEARFPGYETTLKAKVAGEKLSGEIALVHERGKVL